MKAERRMTYKQWRRLFIRELLGWGVLALGVAGFFLGMFYYWLMFGYVL